MKQNENIRRITSYLGMALLGGLIAVGIHTQLYQAPAAAGGADAQPTTVHYVNQAQPTALAMENTDFTVAAAKSVDAVVHVTVQAMVQQAPVYNFFWGYQQRPPQEVRGAGSGVIITDDGYIVTNNHVIQQADNIKVHLNDNRQFDATVVGRDPSTDIALIKIDAHDLPTLAFGNSDEVQVGQWVLAVGNPLNLTSTVTAGIVSAKARNINILRYDPEKDVFPIESFIQTDAAVNPGNSGGALVDTHGALVGINSAIASTTGSYTGYSFAIPSNLVAKVTHDLMEFGHVRRAYMGVTISDINQEMADQLGLGRLDGVFVKEVTSNGAAKKAGIQDGDVIVKVGAIPVSKVPELQGQLGRFSPGDRVAVTVVRQGRELVKELTLLDRTGEERMAQAAPRETLMPSLGAELMPASAEELRSLRIDHGVKVARLAGGKLRSVGIREGFIITKVDQQPIRSVADLERALKNKQGGVLIEGIYPNGKRAYYGLGV